MLFGEIWFPPDQLYGITPTEVGMATPRTPRTHPHPHPHPVPRIDQTFVNSQESFHFKAVVSPFLELHILCWVDVLLTSDTDIPQANCDCHVQIGVWSGIDLRHRGWISRLLHPCGTPNWPLHPGRMSRPDGWARGEISSDNWLPCLSQETTELHGWPDHLHLVLYILCVSVFILCTYISITHVT